MELQETKILKFATFLSINHVKGSNYIKQCHQIAKGNHDFPSHLSSKRSIFLWLERHGYNDEVINSFETVWEIFESKPYCTIKNSKQQKKYID